MIRSKFRTSKFQVCRISWVNLFGPYLTHQGTTSFSLDPLSPSHFMKGSFIALYLIKRIKEKQASYLDINHLLYHQTVITTFVKE